MVTGSGLKGAEVRRRKEGLKIMTVTEDYISRVYPKDNMPEPEPPGEPD